MMSCRSDLQASRYTWYWPFQALVFYATLMLLGTAMLIGSLLCVVLAWVMPHDAGSRLDVLPGIHQTVETMQQSYENELGQIAPAAGHDAS
jgi:hypothetical protein